MPALTIRNLDPDIKARLRVRAAQEGRSMEEHVRILIAKDTALATAASATKSFALQVHELFADMGGVEFPVSPRLVEREPPDFSEH